MAAVSGSFNINHTNNVSVSHIDNADNPLGIRNNGTIGIIYFTAQSDPGGSTGPCFRVQGPEAYGWIKKVVSFPVTGATATADFVLAIADTEGASHTATIAFGGSNNHIGTNYIGPFAGPLSFSISTMGAASKRATFGIIVDQNE